MYTSTTCTHRYTHKAYRFRPCSIDMLFSYKVDIPRNDFKKRFYLNDNYFDIVSIYFFLLGMNSVTFELIDGAILTSPSIATSGVISSKEGVGVITCCLACAGTGNCAGIFYDSSLSICKPYSFQNYTAMNIYGIQNFVKISPGTIITY